MSPDCKTIKDKTFKPYMKAEELQQICTRLGKQITADYAGRKPVFVIVLNGAFMFACDLLKNVDLECRVTSIRVSSYEGMKSTSEVKEHIGLTLDVKDQDVVLIEDIVDTGVTMDNLIEMFKAKEPKSLAICSLLFKPSKFTKDFKIDYIGKSIPNEFVVGYGFDYDDFGRNLPDIYSIKE